MASQTVPKGLGAAGKRLWRRIAGDYELDQRELLLLEAAARQADMVERLEAALVDSPLEVKGVAGQPVVNGLIVEARQGRTVLARLLGQLNLPDEDDRPMSARSQRARRAANSRWSRTAEQRKVRRNGPAA